MEILYKADESQIINKIIKIIKKARTKKSGNIVKIDVPFKTIYLTYKTKIKNNESKTYNQKIKRVLGIDIFESETNKIIIYEENNKQWLL